MSHIWVYIDGISWTLNFWTRANIWRVKIKSSHLNKLFRHWKVYFSVNLLFFSKTSKRKFMTIFTLLFLNPSCVRYWRESVASVVKKPGFMDRVTTMILSSKNLYQNVKDFYKQKDPFFQWMKPHFLEKERTYLDIVPKARNLRYKRNGKDSRLVLVSPLCHIQEHSNTRWLMDLLIHWNSSNVFKLPIHIISSCRIYIYRCNILQRTECIHRMMSACYSPCT